MKTTRKMLIFTVMILVGGAVGNAQVPTDFEVRRAATKFDPILAMQDCTFPGVERTARCGTLTVLEDPAGPADPYGRKIDLKLVVLPAKSGKPGADAVTYLVGGPGQAATPSVGFFGDSLSGIQQNHDLVLVDQRGTGRSNPLDCELTAGELTQAIVAGHVQKSSLESCLARLDADPALYTTPIAMDDLDSVRAALGYERFHVIGISYGTRAALVYARRHPQRVASLVLRGVTSPADNIPLSWLQSGEAAMAELQARCAADSSCHAAFPKLGQQLGQVVRDLEDGNVMLTVEQRGGQPAVELEVTTDVFVGALQFALYSDRSSVKIPRLIDRAAAGDFVPFGQVAAGAFLAAGQSLHLGMYLSVICTEDMPFLDPQDFGESWSFQRPQVLANLAETCRAWPSGVLPAGYKQAVASAVPTLLLSGSADPATSALNAQEVAGHLPNSRHLVTPGLGHHPSWTSCFANLAGAVVNGAEVDQLNVACVEEARTSDFDVPIPQRTWMFLAALGVIVLVVLLRSKR